jgi:hypothetical protein
MSIEITEPESTMLKKVLVTLGATVAALGVSSAALADHSHRGPGYGWRAKQHQGHYQPYYYRYAPPPPVTYYPAPMYPALMYPAPMYPAPVYRAAPVYAPPGISIRFNLPL